MRTSHIIATAVRDTGFTSLFSATPSVLNTLTAGNFSRIPYEINRCAPLRSCRDLQFDNG